MKVATELTYRTESRWYQWEPEVRPTRRKDGTGEDRERMKGWVKLATKRQTQSYVGSPAGDALAF